MSGDFKGYPIELEDLSFIASLPRETAVLAMRGTYNEVRLDPRELAIVENQSRQGACAGHSLSSVLEWIYVVIQGKPEWFQLSRAMGYYETQRLDGIRGDSGSTIGGGVRLAKTVGLCREELWKYPSNYNPARPQNYQAVLADAKHYVVGSSVAITSYDGYRTFLGAGLGGIHQGIAWNSSVDRPLVESYSGSGGGGHSICALCLSERVDKNGEPYAWILNSWDNNWGQNGWAEWSPTAIRQMLQSRNTTFVGLSDMPNMKPREYTLAQIQKDLRI
jgi:hypothetical protein